MITVELLSVDCFDDRESRMYQQADNLQKKKKKRVHSFATYSFMISEVIQHWEEH